MVFHTIESLFFLADSFVQHKYVRNSIEIEKKKDT
jgi:hypothetical protein